MSDFLKLVESALPLTVVFAIVLFFTKEGIEFFKRRSERRRKVAAYKMLLAEESMKNAFTIKTLSSVFWALVDPDLESLKVSKKSNGQLAAEFSFPYGSRGGSVIPVVHTAIFDKSIVDLAVIDKEFFFIAKDAYEDLAHVDNCRDQISSLDTTEGDLMLESLARYALDVLSRSDESLQRLYLMCAGQELECKVRSFVK